MPGRTKAQGDASSQDADMQDVPPSAQEEIGQDAEMREDAEAEEEEEEEEIEAQRVRIVWRESGIIESLQITNRNDSFLVQRTPRPHLNSPMKAIHWVMP